MLVDVKDGELVVWGAEVVFGDDVGEGELDVVLESVGEDVVVAEFVFVPVKVDLAGTV